jgi:RNA polymerase sigma-70 factor (ECF subfamily)
MARARGIGYRDSSFQMSSATARRVESAQRGVQDPSAVRSAYVSLQQGGGNESADAHVVERLRRGDAGTLGQLVRRYERRMVKLALKYVRDRGTAEDVVQETWLAVLTDIHRFEGRGPLMNWIYAILVNLAKTRGVRDARVIPVAFGEESQGEVPEASPEATLPRGSGVRGGCGVPWDGHAHLRRSVHEVVCDRETMAAVVSAIEGLPVSQRAVIYLRDIRGLCPSEVCEILGISDGAQRVQLHRARNRVCAAVAAYLDHAGVSAPGSALPADKSPREGGSWRPISRWPGLGASRTHVR